MVFRRWRGPQQSMAAPAAGAAAALLAAFALPSLLPGARAQDAAPPAAPPAATPVAPAPNEVVDAAVMARIREEGMNRSQLPQTLAHLTDVIGPRVTNSPGMKQANLWTRDKLTAWGLANARLEPWGPFGRGWDCPRFSAQVIGPVPFPLIALPKAWSPGWKGTKTVEVVYVDATDAAGLEKYRGKLKGKAVLMGTPPEVKAHFTPEGSRYTDEQLAALAVARTPTRPGQGGGRQQPPAGGDPAARQEFAARAAAQRFAPRRLRFLLDEGALLTLEPARGDGGTLFVQQASVAPAKGEPDAPAPAPGAGGGQPGGANQPQRPRVSPWSKEAEGRILPQVAVSAEHFNRLLRTVKAGDRVRVAVEMQARFHDADKGMAFNTVADIPGTDKAGEVVLCGAHLDSWHGGTGATDNGAGVAVCMEAVRILKTLGVKPRRTIRVALWSGEEQGIFGSAGYVQQHLGTAAQPKPDYANFSAYFNLDNGTGKIRGVWCQGNEAVMPIFAAWLAPFHDLGATTVTLRNTGGTDHLPFDRVGLPGFQFIQDTIEYDARTHHSNQDVYDRIQTEDLKQAATVMAAFLYNAAMREEKLPRKPAAPPSPTAAAAQ